MVNNHLSEEEVQDYALNSSACDAIIAAHVLLCDACKTRVENYRVLFTGIKQQPEPVFDFNLEALVLSKLTQPKAKTRPKVFLSYLLIVASVVVPAIILYLFKQYWIGFFNDIAIYTVLLILISFIIVLGVLCIDIFRTYQKKMNSLNYY
jgi:hypothetical protein